MTKNKNLVVVEMTKEESDRHLEVRIYMENEEIERRQDLLSDLEWIYENDLAAKFIEWEKQIKSRQFDKNLVIYHYSDKLEHGTPSDFRKRYAKMELKH